MVTYYLDVTDDDRVFKALADPTRRFLLDRLFERDGRTLTELESELEMTRFGVMKHLRVLEDAGLVVAHRSGREKLHFLNPVPIRLLHDRWIDKYTERQVSALANLKAELEDTACANPRTRGRDARLTPIDPRGIPLAHPLLGGAGFTRRSATGNRCGLRTTPCRLGWRSVRARPAARICGHAALPPKDYPVSHRVHVGRAAGLEARGARPTGPPCQLRPVNTMTRTCPGATRRGRAFGFATWALDAGLSIFELARYMGTSVEMIDRTYGHLAKGAEDAARAKLDAYATRTVTGVRECHPITSVLR